jgi:hypothetical protein
MIIQEIIRVIGLETKDLKKNLEALPGKHSIDLLQKTSIRGI